MNNNYMYKKIAPFKWFVLQNFPFIEEDFDAITNWQLFCKLGEEINKVINSTNLTGEQVENLTNSFIELQNYVNEYFENLDVQNEVNIKLDEMAEDGTLEQIINQEIFAELNEKIESAMLKTDNQSYQNITLERLFRTFIDSYNNPDRDSTTSFPYLQGGCYVGNDKVVICQNKGDNNNRIAEISLIDGSVVRTANVSVGHGNSIAFDNQNNKLYITGLSDTDNHTLFVMNYTTFALETPIVFNTLDNDENVHSVSYDYVNNKMYLMTETSPTNYITIYELDLSNGDLTEIELDNYDNTLNTTNTNDMCVYNDILYIMKHNPQLIITYKISNKKLQNLYNIENTLSNGIAVGELQNISVMFDKDIKDYLIMSNKLDCINGYYNMFQYFKCNPVYNVKKPVVINDNNTFKTILVDINSTAINPDGSSSNRFKYLSEAFEVATKYNNVEILAETGTYPYLSISGIKGHIACGGTSLVINGLNIKGCDYVYFFGATVSNTYSEQNEDIISDFSGLRLSNITVDNSKDQNILIHHTLLELNGVSNAKIYSQGENSITCYDNTPDYIITGGRLPSINKPVKMFNGDMSSTSQSTTYDLSANLFKNAQHLRIIVHGNYGYSSVIIPNLLSDGTRIIPALLGTWYTQLQLQRTGDVFSIKIFSSKVINTTITDNISSATGDFVVYAEN